MPSDEMQSDTDPKKGVPGAGRYIVIAASVGIVAVLAVILVAVLGSNGRTDNAADGGTKAASSVPPDSSSPSAPDSTLTSTSAGSPGTDSSSATKPSTSVSTPPSASKTAPPPSAGDVSGQPALPPISGAEVVITSVTSAPGTHSIDVSAAVNGITTLDGTCTATATMGSESAKASVKALFDGRGMSCGSITIPMQGKPGGKWKVTVVFTAAVGTTESAAATVEIK
ncbi:hypothetical protein CLV47_101487 [Antricoccus suffuscus]|uniref:Uncharacterized protein n=1 Tax=Antricoccus suffuscus TaxID=1629062 RepID=A0A2T1A6Y6_9ACTN|nr:hypothetical protein CLV47_101487 [Antricoccus suffuscus]